MGKKKEGNLAEQGIEELRSVLVDIGGLEEQVHYLLLLPKVDTFLAKNRVIKRLLDQADLQKKRYLLEAISSEKAGLLFEGIEDVDNPEKSFEKWVAQIEPLYTTLSPMDGILGYLSLAMKVISKKSQPLPYKEIDPPPVTSIEHPSEGLKTWIRKGIESMGILAEVYAIGGAGDRLNLQDSTTGEPLPQALLELQGRTLLEGLIRDLKARENLARKFLKKGKETPIILMTSPEKDNTRRILALLEEKKYFERDKNSFLVLEQPNVPVIDMKGFFQASAPFCMETKPGGHGALWLLLEKSKTFDWLQEKGRSKMIIRQINNPLASIDYNLIALLGFGVQERKQFGFLSCPRQSGSAEGLNVLVKTRNEDGDFCTLSNLEYTETEGIKTIQASSALFPANTNILFADLKSVREVMKRNSLPGMIFNSKNGKTGRLESTMQNIADSFLDPIGKALIPERTFVLLNSREKTISVTKKAYKEGETLKETPPGAFLALQMLWGRFLLEKTQSQLPPFGDPFSPGYLLDIGPSVGPLWELISKKMAKIVMEKGAEFRLDISDVLVENLSIEGSFSLKGDTGAKAIIKNVKIVNRGPRMDEPASFWTGKFLREEECKIIVEKGAELFIEDVTLQGDREIFVPAGHSLTIIEKEGTPLFQMREKSRKTALWHYQFLEDDSILLTFKRRREKMVPRPHLGLL